LVVSLASKESLPRGQQDGGFGFGSITPSGCLDGGLAGDMGMAAAWAQQHHQAALATL